MLQIEKKNESHLVSVLIGWDKIEHDVNYTKAIWCTYTYMYHLKANPSVHVTDSLIQQFNNNAHISFKVTTKKKEPTHTWLCMQL